MIKQAVKSTLLAVAPRLFREISAYRSQKLIISLETRRGLVAQSNNFIAVHGDRVLGGPFKGMKYPEFTRCRNLIMKLLGCYETEIHGMVEDAIKAGYSTVVNVGSADGYYTVGLALRLPNTPVIAFDTDRWARKATQLLVDENRAANVEIRTMCTVEWVQRELPRNSLLLVDTEGFEDVLLHPLKTPNLLFSDIIVETHEMFVPGIEKVLIERFSPTHDIQIERSGTRDPAEYPELSAIPPEFAAAVIFEGRPCPQSWLYLTRKAGAGKA